MSNMDLFKGTSKLFRLLSINAFTSIILVNWILVTITKEFVTATKI